MSWVTFPGSRVTSAGPGSSPLWSELSRNRIDAHQKTPEQARTELSASSEGGGAVTADKPRAAAMVAVRARTSLVVRVRGDRALLLCRAGRHRRLSRRVLPPGHAAGRLSRLVRAVARGARQQGVRVDPARHLRRAWRAADAADPPLGRADLRRGGVPAAAAAVFHRCVPSAARAEMAGLGDPPHPRHSRGLDRLDLAR
jgi:hypothetical protein